MTFPESTKVAHQLRDRIFKHIVKEDVRNGRIEIEEYFDMYFEVSVAQAEATMQQPYLGEHLAALVRIKENRA